MEHQTVQAFLDSLAGDSATPGGGGVAALNGAMGAALVSMVCRLTIGRKKYAEYDAEMREILEKSESLRTALTALMAADVAAFDGVMAAFGMPKATDAEKSTRRQAIQSALKEATRVPLETARACAAVIALAKPVAEKGNVNAASDAGSAAQSALAGLNSAALNVKINLASLKDEAFVSETAAALARIVDGAAATAAEIYATVESRM